MSWQGLSEIYRESLVARAPETVDFPVTVPERARLDLAVGTPEERPVDRMTLSEAKAYLAEGRHFAEGSMEPKIRAVVGFLERGGAEAIITDPENVERALAGEAGTRIVAD